MNIWVISTLAIVNNAAMDIGIQIPVWVPDVKTPRSGIAGSSYNFLRNNCTAFHTVYSGVLYSHWQCSRVSISLYSFQHLLFSGFFKFFIVAILMGKKWYLIVVLICISLMIIHGEGNGTPLQYSCLENPWTKKAGRLQSMGLLRVGNDWATPLSLFTFMHWRRKWQPTPVFLPGEPQGWGSLVGCRLWGRTESDTTEAT